MLNVQREPNGRVQRPTKATTAVYWQREREALRSSARDSRLGTPLGMMFRAEAINARQFGAGARFAADRADADVALSLPSRHCTAQDIVTAKGKGGKEDDAKDARRKAAIIRAYDEAERAVGLGSRELAALQHVAVYERTPDSYEMRLALIRGLDLLVKHYKA